MEKRQCDPAHSPGDPGRRAHPRLRSGCRIACGTVTAVFLQGFSMSLRSACIYAGPGAGVSCSLMLSIFFQAFFCFCSDGFCCYVFEFTIFSSATPTLPLTSSAVFFTLDLAILIPRSLIRVSFHKREEGYAKSSCRSCWTESRRRRQDSGARLHKRRLRAAVCVSTCA